MKIIAHRSGPTVYPEQTILSAKLALQQGADFVEIDTRFTEDGKIAVSHDSNAERVFGVAKEIDEMTAAEYKTLRHKSAPDFEAHLLEEYLDADIAPLLIHVKEGGDRLPALLETLNRKNYSGKFVLGLQTTEDIRFVKQTDVSIPVLAFMGKPERIRESAEAGADFIRLWEDWITDERIEEIHALDKECWIMVGRGETVGETSDEALKAILQKEIDGILINDITKIK